MTLEPGTKLGPHKILERIGAGREEVATPPSQNGHVFQIAHHLIYF